MAAKPHHPFYQTVSILAHGLPEQQEHASELAILIAAELASTLDAPIGRKMLSEKSVSIDTVLESIDRHVPDNGTAENALLRSHLEMLLFRALYDLRHPEIHEPDTIITGLQMTTRRPDSESMH